MKPDSDNIEKLIFSFEYEDKSLASKCNTIVESIFKTQIFPEIKNGIDNILPKKVFIKLESLEIDIGTINEKELPTELAKRVKTALKEALQIALNDKHDGFHRNDVLSVKKPNEYLMSVLELYLQRGYFPAWFNQKISLDKILKNVIDKEQTELIQMIMKNKGNESFIKRLEFSLEPKTFKRIYSKMESMSLEEVQKLPKEDNSKLTQKLTIEDKLHQESSISDKAIDNYRLKIVIHYLEFGYLPAEFKELNQFEIQNIFHELILSKDPFLANIIQSDQNPELLYVNIKHVLRDDIWSLLFDYLEHYFQDSSKYLEQIILKFRKEIESKNRLNIDWNSLKNEILIMTLLTSRGKYNLPLFKYTVSRRLFEHMSYQIEVNSEFVSDFIYTRHIFEIKEEDIKSRDNESIDSDIAYLMESNILELFQILTNKGSNTPNENQISINSSINKLTYYLIAYPEKLRLVLNQKQLDLKHVFTVFRFYLTDKNWDIFKDTFSTDAVLKNEIINFNQTVEDIYISLQTKSFKVINELKKIGSEDDVYKLKTILLIVLKEQNYFDEVFEAYKAKRISLENHIELRSFQNYANALMNFVPKSLPKDVPSEFWHKLVLRFIIKLKIDQNHLLIHDFTSLFLTHVKKEVKRINREFLYFELLFELGSTDKKILSTLFSDYVGTSINEKKITTLQVLNNDYAARKTDNFTTSDIKSQTYKHLSNLAFYANNRFFPWWSDFVSLTELIISIFNLNQNLGSSFEPICLEVEEESEFMEPMVSILPKHLIEVFSVICAQHVRLNSKWQEILSLFENKQDLKDSNSNNLISNSLSNEFEEEQHLIKNQLAKERPLQKAIYFLKDEEILNKWLKENSVIKEQLLSYLKLAPFMYYREINPSRWRELVYKFAFDYYKLIEHKPNKKFHVSFLEFLQKSNDNIPWKEVFKTIYYKKQAEDIKQDPFPKELLLLIGLEPFNDKLLNMQALENMEEESLNEICAEIKIYNSGLIILWPFLTQFFEQLSLVINGEFLNDISRNRSVFLLQQLVYGSIDFPEHVLPLNKLLVGLPFERPLSPIEELTNQEKELSLNLLNGLMANWGKVKNSSFEGIRETFLQREGMLSIKKDKYLLKVEKKGVDILLSSIPWSISLIKLTWMQKPLYVEWI